MARTHYSELLRDPRWQRKRLEILQRDSFTCLECKSSDKELHIHHIYYVAGRSPWAYPDFAYETLCFECHAKFQPDSPATWELFLGELSSFPGSLTEIIGLVLMLSTAGFDPGATSRFLIARLAELNTSIRELRHEN